ARSQASNARRHRRAISTNRHASPFCCRWSACRPRRGNLVDADNGRATIAQMCDCADYTHVVFLRGGDGPARLKCTSSSNDFYFARRLLFRTKSFPLKQSGGSGLLSSLLEYKRTLFCWFSALLRRRGGDCVICRSALWIFAALRCTGFFFAAEFVTVIATFHAGWIRMVVARRLGFSRGLDRFFTICPLVLSYRHAGFIACEPSSRPDCLFRSRDR